MKLWVMSSTRRTAVGKRYASNVDRVTLCYVLLECFSRDVRSAAIMIGFKQIEFFDHTSPAKTELHKASCGGNPEIAKVPVDFQFSDLTTSRPPATARLPLSTASAAADLNMRVDCAGDLLFNGMEHGKPEYKKR
jgi:hypothetical protein